MSTDPNDDGYFRTLFNAIPSAVVIVDDDVRVEDANAAGYALLGGKEAVLKRRGGDILNCIHALETSAGCGHGAGCADCIIRNSVKQAVSGACVSRMRTRMELRTANGTTEVYLLVTASPFSFEGKPLVLLLLEDINELVALKALLPICAWCRKIRDDDQYWQTVESYLKKHADVDFSHSICEECYEKMDKSIK
jgi:PAS domain-containing protein